jgi:hypothetical protein
MAVGVLLLWGTIARAEEPASRPTMMDAQRRAAVLMAKAGEIAGLPPGVNLLKDGTTVIKSGNGMATIKPDGGLGMGTIGGGAVPPGNDPESQWQVGLFLVLFRDTKDLKMLGISEAMAKELTDTYNNVSTEPLSEKGVKQAFDAYQAANDPDEKAEAEAKLLEQVNVYGERQTQAAAARLVKLKHLLTDEQLEGLKKKGAPAPMLNGTTQPVK